ncbi:MAG TPA: ABC transporter ATP-binding protein [Polyangiaceae bacterium]|nr:ABC transporter ATP-binding protein [Polyangiaceae bacterium]
MSEGSASLESVVKDPPRGSERPKAERRTTDEVLRAFHEETDIVKAYDARLLARLWPFVRPHARSLYLSFGLLLVTAAASLVRPLIMRSILDAGSIAKDTDAMMRGGWILLGVVLVEQTLTFFQVYSMQLAGARSMADLRAYVFRFLHGLRLGFFDRQPIGRLVTRVTNDIDAIGELFASGALNAVGDLVRLLGIVVMMLVLDWRLSLIAFAALPPVALFVNGIRHGSRKAFRDIRTKTARMNAFLNEQVSGMAVVQAFGRERAASAEFDETNRAYRDANFRAIKFEASLDAAIEMVSSMCVALILVAAGMHASSVGLVVAFIAYIRQFFEPISNLSQRYTLLQSALTGAERVFELLESSEIDASSAAPAPEAGVVAGSGPSDMAFELAHVDFEYKKGVPVLHQVNLSVKKGEKIAIVGATGSGKTTIASLLLRLYEPSSGAIRVLGRDVRDYAPGKLRRNFAVVPQDVYLFPGTIATNVAVGEATPDPARVEAALDHVSGLDLFTRREGGIDAAVNERGANFSAGERQLIAFARALYKNPPILILDEATASVDSDTESRLQRALAVLMEGRTALIIAHRLSTIRAVDRIVVLSKGRVVEEGPHEELLAKNGLYARLYRLKSAQDAERLEGA